MWESLIAVGGTLAGGLVASVVQLRGARAERCRRGGGVMTDTPHDSKN